MGLTAKGGKGGRRSCASGIANTCTLRLHRRAAGRMERANVMRQGTETCCLAVPKQAATPAAYVSIVANSILARTSSSQCVVVVFDEPSCLTLAKRQEQQRRDAARTKQGSGAAPTERLPNGRAYNQATLDAAARSRHHRSARRPPPLLRRGGVAAQEARADGEGVGAGRRRASPLRRSRCTRRGGRSERSEKRRYQTCEDPRCSLTSRRGDLKLSSRTGCDSCEGSTRVFGCEVRPFLYHRHGQHWHSPSRQGASSNRSQRDRAAGRRSAPRRASGRQNGDRTSGSTRAKRPTCIDEGAPTGARRGILGRSALPR